MKAKDHRRYYNVKTATWIETMVVELEGPEKSESIAFWAVADEEGEVTPYSGTIEEMAEFLDASLVPEGWHRVEDEGHTPRVTNEPPPFSSNDFPLPDIDAFRANRKLLDDAEKRLGSL